MSVVTMAGASGPRSGGLVGAVFADPARGAAGRAGVACAPAPGVVLDGPGGDGAARSGVGRRREGRRLRAGRCGVARRSSGWNGAARPGAVGSLLWQVGGLVAMAVFFAVALVAGAALVLQFGLGG